MSGGGFFLRENWIAWFIPSSAPPTLRSRFAAPLTAGHHPATGFVSVARDDIFSVLWDRPLLGAKLLPL